MKTAQFKLESANGVSLIQHRLVLTYSTAGTSKTGSEIRQIVRTLSKSGVLAIDLPKDLDEKVKVTVHAPDGDVVFVGEVTLPTRNRPVHLKVPAKSFGPLQQSQNPQFRQPHIARGRLLDAGTGLALEHATLSVHATQLGADKPMALAAVQTGKGGYFTLPYPLGTFAEAWAMVGVPSKPVIPVQLVQKGNFPEKVVLLADLTDRDRTSLDQTRGASSQPGHDLPPRFPSAVELIENPEAFSSDLGTGEALQFYKPNRVLEEFSFYSVVRTTEPHIKALYLDDPLEFSVEELENYLQNHSPGDSREGSSSASTTSGSPAASGSTSTGSSTGRRSSEELESLMGTLGTGGGEGGGVSLRSKAVLPNQQVEAGLLRALDASLERNLDRELSLAAEYTLRNRISRFAARKKTVAPGRVPLDGNNPLDWDDEPTLYQCTTIAHGHLLHFKQQWVADGFSLGDLLNSLPLAPCQKKKVAIIDWTHQQQDTREEGMDISEGLQAEISRTRDISEIMSAMMNEDLQGSSRSRVRSTSGGAGLGFLSDFVGGVLGVSSGTSSSSASSEQSGSRKTSADMLNSLTDRTMQAAASVRALHSTIVTTSIQGESVRAQTEIIANYNHGHAMTIQYFQVLRHFLVRQRLADVRECLFVPMEISPFDPSKVLRWRESLHNNLLPAAAPLAAGFKALERISENYRHDPDFVDGMMAKEMLETMDGYLDIQLLLKRPSDKTPEETYADLINKAETSAETEAEKMAQLERWAILSSPYQANQWKWFPIWFPNKTSAQYYKDNLKDKIDKDAIFHETLAPTLAEKIVDNLVFYAIKNEPGGGKVKLPLKATLVDAYNRNHASLRVSVRHSGGEFSVTRQQIDHIEIRLQNYAGTDEEPLPAGSKVILHRGYLSYKTRNLASSLVANNEISHNLANHTPLRLFTPLKNFEMRQPRVTDRRNATRLLVHLNENIEFYHRAIWMEMDANRRFLLLDRIQAPGIEGRSLASVVENRVIGIVGNSLVMPVAHGFHLDPTYRQDKDHPVDLFEHYQPATEPDPFRLAVPTRGVFAEAVLGNCNSCEKIEEDRFWRWHEVPCPDTLTEINPVTAQSNMSPAIPMYPTTLPSSIIQMQTPEQAPAPGLTTSAIQAISTPFRDATGLAATQANTMAALQATLDSAQNYARGAQNLAIQGNMQRGIDKTRSLLGDGVDLGYLTPQEAGDLYKQAIRAQIGGGVEPAATPGSVSNEELFNSANAAVEQGCDVEVAAGNQSLKVGQTQRSEAKTERTASSTDKATATNLPIYDPPTDYYCNDDAFQRGFLDETGKPIPSGRTKITVYLNETSDGVRMGFFDIRITANPGSIKLIGKECLWIGSDISQNGEKEFAIEFDCLLPGRCTVTIDFCPIDRKTGENVQRLTLIFSVPMFVHVLEDEAQSFRTAIGMHQLANAADLVFESCRKTIAHLFRHPNIRFFWGEGSKQQLPTHLQTEENYTQCVTRIHLNKVHTLGDNTGRTPGDIVDAVRSFYEEIQIDRERRLFQAIAAVKNRISSIAGLAGTLDNCLIAGDDIEIFGESIILWDTMGQLSDSILDKRKMTRDSSLFEIEPTLEEVSDAERPYLEQHADFCGRFFGHIIVHELLHNLLGDHTEYGDEDILQEYCPSGYSGQALFFTGIVISDEGAFPTDGTYFDKFAALLQKEEQQGSFIDADIPGMGQIVSENRLELYKRLPLPRHLSTK